MGAEKDLKARTREAAEKSKGFFGEFRKFIMRGNVVDMAVGVIIGAAFQKIITSLVNDIIMPLISRLTGGVDFSNWFVSLDGKEYKTLAAAQKAGAATLNYGTFITAVIDFILMAFVIFLLVKTLNSISDRFKKAPEEEEPKTKTCPFCKTDIPIDAVRCPHCTSDLTKEAK